MKKTAMILVLLTAGFLGTYAITSRGNKESKIDEKATIEQSNKADRIVEFEASKEENTESSAVMVEDEEVKDKQEVEKGNLSAIVDNKEDLDNSEGKSRPEAFYVEELIFNFSSLYTAAVNKENMNISILDNVIMPNSEFYIYVKGQIEEYKKQKATIRFETFDIKSVKDSAKDRLDITVYQVMTVAIEKNTEEKSETVIYTVQFDNDRMGIIKHRNADN